MLLGTSEARRQNTQIIGAWLGPPYTDNVLLPQYYHIHTCHVREICRTVMFEK